MPDLSCNESASLLSDEVCTVLLSVYHLLVLIVSYCLGHNDTSSRDVQGYLPGRGEHTSGAVTLIAL